MRIRQTTAVLLSAALLTTAGCASRPKGPTFHEHGMGVPIDEIYDSAHRSGSRDAVQLLREGMRSQYMHGVRDPYYPVRQPEEIIPVFVPPRVDEKTGRRVEGHWEHSVVRWSDWVD